jgi:hypothetical protein
MASKTRTSVSSRLTYANVTATVALFLALGGGATAIALQGRNTVRSDDIAPRSVKSSDIAVDTVRSSDVADESLDTRDIDEQELGLVPSVQTRASGNTQVAMAGSLDIRKPFEPYPLANDTWQQGPGETDYASIQITTDAPQGCTGSIDGINGLELRVLVDGDFIGEVTQTIPIGTATRTAGPFAVFESGAERQRRIEVRVRTQCEQPVTIEGMQANVIGFV